MKKICEYCGQPFETKYSKAKYCKRVHYNKCAWCGKEFAFTVHPAYTPKTCSEECNKLYSKQQREKTTMERYGVKNAGFTEESQRKIKQHSLEKYGTEWVTQSDEFKEKAKKTCLEKYGVENAHQNEDVKRKAAQTCLDRYGDTCTFGKNSSVRDKIKQSNIEKYGTIDPGNLPEFREKAKQTCLKNHGVEWYLQSEECKTRAKQVSLQRYGVEYFAQSEEIKQKYKHTMMERYGVTSSMDVPGVKEKLAAHNQEKWGVPWPCMRPECLQAQGVQPSRLNRSFGDRLKEIGLDVLFEYHIGHKSYDIKIENSDILIEIDPTYTHTIYNTKLGGLAKSYHKDKSIIASEKGFRCIHVFDWDNQDKIIAILSSRDTIYARKCEVRNVNEKECNEFLTTYHLQNSCKGQDFRLGLYYNDELVQIMTFGSPRYNCKFQYELLRLCTKTGYNVVGGSERLFKHFLQQYDPESIVSYCDNSKFKGDVYAKLGFQLGDDGEPSIHWSKYHNQITDNLLRQRGYDQLFNTDYGKGTSNEQLMLENGWLPVADCGQSRYEWRA